MKKLIGVLLGIVFVFIVAANSFANLINDGDFSAGLASLDSWGHSGDVTVTDAGCFMSLQGMNGYYALFGSNSSNGEASLSQAFNVEGNGITVSFNWAFNFVDLNWNYNDSFIALVSNSHSDFQITIQDLESGILWGDRFGVGLTSGHFSRTYSLAESFTDIEFILSEAGCWTDSFAGIDNVVVTESATSSSPVPEPATMMLFGCGLVGMAAVGRKKIIS